MPCKFYYTKGKCDRGSECRFSHEELSDADYERWVGLAVLPPVGAFADPVAHAATIHTPDAHEPRVPTKPRGDAQKVAAAPHATERATMRTLQPIIRLSSGTELSGPPAADMLPAE